MIYTFIAGRCSDLPVATCCRVMKVSTSGFYQWRARPCSDRDYDDAVLTNTIIDIHRMSRRSYGSPRVHAELRLGLDTFCSRKRVERLMRQAGIAGIYRRRNRGCTRRNVHYDPAEDLVSRVFDVDAPDRPWVMDVTEHPTDAGKLYCAVVLDAFSRRVVGWSIADHIRSELVVDALQMAIWRRQPPEGQTVAHSDHGSQYTSWAFGRRLRAAGLLGSTARSATASTTPWPRASSARCKPSCSTTSPAHPRRPLRCVFPWIRDLVQPTPPEDTTTARCSAPSTTRPKPRPNHHNQPVTPKRGELTSLDGSCSWLAAEG